MSEINTTFDGPNSIDASDLYHKLVEYQKERTVSHLFNKAMEKKILEKAKYLLVSHCVYLYIQILKESHILQI